MTPAQSAFTILIGVFIAVLVFDLIRRHMLREKYAMVWFAIPVFILSIPLLFREYTTLAGFFGIVDPISFFVAVAIVLLLLLCLQFSIALTTAWGQRKTMMQRIAFLEERVRCLETGAPHEVKQKAVTGQSKGGQL